MEKRRFTYPKNEKLKSRTTIELLFTQGRSVSKYPLRLVYIPLEVENREPEAKSEIIKMGVSVSKKHFKKAADRNYYKRLLREAYRHNKHILLASGVKPCAFMFLYQTNARLSYEEINAKTIALFEKFRAQEEH